MWKKHICVCPQTTSLFWFFYLLIFIFSDLPKYSGKQSALGMFIAILIGKILPRRVASNWPDHWRQSHKLEIRPYILENWLLGSDSTVLPSGAGFQRKVLFEESYCKANGRARVSQRDSKKFSEGHQTFMSIFLPLGNAWATRAWSSKNIPGNSYGCCIFILLQPILSLSLSLTCSPFH